MILLLMVKRDLEKKMRKRKAFLGRKWRKRLLRMTDIPKKMKNISKSFKNIKIGKNIKNVKLFQKGLKLKSFNKLRFLSSTNTNIVPKYTNALLWGGALLATTLYITQQQETHSESVDYEKLRADLEDLIESAFKTSPMFDDGSYAGILVRLAWHSSGTYSKVDGTGGSNGANMRFQPESKHGANNGLEIARELLEPIKKKYPGISYADLYTFAGVVAIEATGGPKIKWRAGRSDTPCSDHVKPTPHDRLPDANQGANHLRDIFYRMGFNDQEIVALAGAHCLGRCHTNRSGYTGPWTRSPTSFTNAFFQELLNNKWTPKKWNGPLQYEDPSGDLMMTPADLSLIQDDKFLKYVKIYADDQDKFFNDFAVAYEKLLELGVKFPVKSGTGESGTGELWKRKF
eukprot:TRINITY_DN9035_c0_g1_i1.p1 TRINITY_DN9035_c0_g1~~TRINITY_DN9035_c0_g1_i1.p1  ORF type:complete len:401 (-),score=135.48 TRINITY_DN9035_c0_g1_i1:72-1274(-)